MDKNDYVLPAGIGLLGAGATYLLMRKPIWGKASRFFSNLQKEFGNKASVIYSDELRGISPIREKLFSGFDKVVITKPETNIEGLKGFVIDTRRAVGKSTASSKPTPITSIAMLRPGNLMELGFKLDKELMPYTRVLGDSFPTSSSDTFAKALKDTLKPDELKDTVIKLQSFASGIQKPFKTEDVLNNPSNFFNNYLEAGRKTNSPVGLYVQKEIPGEVYRASIVGHNVVPNSVSFRHDTIGSILDRILPARIKTRKSIEKKLSDLLDSDTSFIKKLNSNETNKGNIPMYNPDFIVSKDSLGNIQDIKLIDLNMGAAGNVIASTNPIGEWTLTKALTGKQPIPLAVGAATIAGTGSAVSTSMILGKKKKKVK